MIDFNIPWIPSVLPDPAGAFAESLERAEAARDAANTLFAPR
jgi:hypothetical protein